jgi:hypothetical protein
MIFTPVKRALARLRSFPSGFFGLMALYFLSSCIQMFPMVSISMTLIGNLKFTSSDLSLYYTVTFIPWNLRAILGLLSDSYPIFGSRRKSYILICFCAIAVGFILFGKVAKTAKAAFAVGTGLSFFLALAESVLDARGVELVIAAGEIPSTTGDRREKSVNIQSSSMVCRTLGSLASILLAGALSTIWDPDDIICIAAIFPAIGFLITAVIPMGTSPSQESHRAKQFIEYLKACIRDRRRPVELLETLAPIILPCVFVLIYASCPSSNIAFMTFVYTSFGFSNAQLHIVSLCSMIGSLGGTVIYWLAFRNFQSIRLGFLITLLVGALASTSRILVVHVWSDFHFVLMDELLVNAALRLALMPIQVYGAIAASSPSCAMLEGFVFGLFVSIENWGGTISGILSAILSDKLSLTQLIIASACTNLVPLLALCAIPSNAIEVGKSGTDSTEKPDGDNRVIYITIDVQYSTRCVANFRH